MRLVGPSRGQRVSSRPWATCPTTRSTWPRRRRPSLNRHARAARRLADAQAAQAAVDCIDTDLREQCRARGEAAARKAVVDDTELPVARRRLNDTAALARGLRLEVQIAEARDAVSKAACE